MVSLLDFLTDNLPQFRKARLASLYSDFRQQQYSNPDGYTANLGAWETALAFVAEKQAVPGSLNTFVISAGDDLLDALESREWGRPSALGTVFSEAVTAGHFASMSVFFQAKPGLVEHGNTSISWRLAAWTLKQFGVSSWMADQMPEGEFVVLENLKKAKEKLAPLMSERRGRVDQIWPMERFKSKVSKSLNLKNTISHDDLKVLLVYLSRDQNVLAYEDNFVKFRASASESVKITEQDRNVASLKTLIHDLSSQTKQLSDKIETLNREARSALADKNKLAALRHLRSKKVQESLLSQRGDTLAQLEDVLNQIEQAANQVDVMKVLKSSTSVLKGLNAELGGMDSVQDVLDSISEEMLHTREISDAIGDTAQSGLFIDEQEIDDELTAMEAQVEDENTEDDIQQVQERLDRLPGLAPVPTKEKPEELARPLSEAT